MSVDKVAAWTDAEATKALRYANEERRGVLNLSYKRMTLAGARRLAEALRHNPELARGIRVLDLGFNHELGDAGLAAVADGLAAVAAPGGGSGSGGGKFALEGLGISTCGLKDLSVLLASSFSSSSSPSSPSSTSSPSATVGADASWLSGLKKLYASGNPLTEFPATLCGELTGLNLLNWNGNKGTTLRLPAELCWLPKGCEIWLKYCKGVQVARGPNMSGGFVDVPAKFTGKERHGIHDMLSELNIAPIDKAAPVEAQEAALVEAQAKDLRKEARTTFSHYYLSEQLSDVQFEVKAFRLPAHRFVLAARSEYWRTMLFGSTASSSREGTSGVITPDCTVAALKVILRHVYTFETDAALVGDGVTVRVVLEVGELSEMYELPKLRDACADFLCVENACSMFEGGLEFGPAYLAKLAEAFIVANGAAILQTEDFFKLRPESLAQILSLEELHKSVNSEVGLFSAVSKYADKHAEIKSDEARRDLVEDALKGIRFSEMTTEELSTTVASSKLLANEELMPLLLYVGSKGVNGSPLSLVALGCAESAFSQAAGEMAPKAAGMPAIPTASPRAQTTPATSQAPTALATFSRYYLSEQLSDVQFEVKAFRLPAHRFVLAARSEYWRTMLFGSTASSSREGTSGVITPDCTVAALKVILRHVYTFETDAALARDKVTVRVVLEVAELCEMYELPKLRDACADFLCVENACSMLEGGLEFGPSHLAKLAEAFIVANGAAILQTEDFFKLRPESLARIVSLEELHESVNSEVELFRAVSKYADKHAEIKSDEARRDLVEDALKGIRFSEMTTEELSTTVASSNLLANEELLPLLLYVGSKGINGSPASLVGRSRAESALSQAAVTAIQPNDSGLPKAPGTLPPTAGQKAQSATANSQIPGTSGQTVDTGAPKMGLRFGQGTGATGAPKVSVGQGAKAPMPAVPTASSSLGAAPLSTAAQRAQSAVTNNEIPGKSSPEKLGQQGGNAGGMGGLNQQPAALFNNMPKGGAAASGSGGRSRGTGKKTTSSFPSGAAANVTKKEDVGEESSAGGAEASGGLEGIAARISPADSKVADHKPPPVSPLSAALEELQAAQTRDKNRKNSRSSSSPTKSFQFSSSAADFAGAGTHKTPPASSPPSAFVFGAGTSLSAPSNSTSSNKTSTSVSSPPPPSVFQFGSKSTSSNKTSTSVSSPPPRPSVFQFGSAPASTYSTPTAEKPASAASAPPVFGAGFQQQAANGGMPKGLQHQANGGGLGGAFALGAGPPRRKVAARRSRR